MGFPLTIVILTVAASRGAGSVTYRADGSAIRERCKAGFRTCRPTTISARITCSTATGFPPCWSAASAFVRTLLPTIAGLSGLSNARFQFFNWMSGLLWVLILTTLGFALGKPRCSASMKIS